jgi:hypothetical protein
MIVGEPHTSLSQTVYVRRLDPTVVAAQVTVAEVIGKY